MIVKAAHNGKGDILGDISLGEENGTTQASITKKFRNYLPETEASTERNCC